MPTRMERPRTRARIVIRGYEQLVHVEKLVWQQSSRRFLRVTKFDNITLPLLKGMDRKETRVVVLLDNRHQSKE